VYRRYLKSIIFPVVVFITWRILIFLYQFFVQPNFIINEFSDTLVKRLFDGWTIYWDSSHYLSIAQNGYQYPEQAFFPLWPILIKIFGFGSPTQITVYILTSSLNLITFVLFYIWAKKLGGVTRAKLALTTLVTFPSAMFFHAGYTENLYLSLTLLTFIFAEQGKFLLSSIFGGLVTATRVVGVSLVILQRKPQYFLIIGLGLVFYMLFLYFSYGDALIFGKAQQAWCQSAGRCGLTFPLLPLIDYGRLILIGWIRPSLSIAFLDWFSTIMFLILLIPVYKNLKKSYFYYCLAVLILPLFSGSNAAMIRYVLAAYPVFYIIPQVVKPKWLLVIMWILMFLLQMRFVGLFTSRMWVA